jgi:putative toxin-antitoxin system antitoxin component (TIGR02293 family)
MRRSASSRAMVSRVAVGRSFAVAIPLPQQIERIRAGLSFHELEKLQKALGVTLEKIGNALGMSRATLHRRKIQRRLAAEESEKLVRYQHLLAKATEVFGDSDNAREWLTHPQRGLGQAIPLEFAKSEMGAREVENLLGRIEYSVYS